MSQVRGGRPKGPEFLYTEPTPLGGVGCLFQVLWPLYRYLGIFPCGH